MKRILEYRHLIMAGFWAAVTIPAAIWWPESVLWVIVVSHYANFVGEVSAHHAERAEKKQDGGDGDNP
jgi:hypothetical protein